MAEVATKVRESGVWVVVKKRWRAWLRAIHRDVGYCAIGFTVIYAVSGIAQNHIEDWGELSYKSYEKTLKIPALTDDMTDDVAIRAVVDRVGLGEPTSKLRTADEVRLEYGNGAKVTAIGDQVTIQGREKRPFIGAANWLHTARNRKGWKYVADAYALLLLYLAISGIFMLKGRLGFKWRGAVLISIGVAVPVTAVLMSSPSGPPKEKRKDEPKTVLKAEPILKPLPPDEPEETPTPPPVPTKKPCDPFSSAHGCK